MPTSENNFLKYFPEGVSLPAKGDEVGQRLLREYGAIFVARNGAMLPPVISFSNEAEVMAYQSQLLTTRRQIRGVEIELQTPAMNALLLAVEEAKAKGLTITPRGKDSARRSYAQTLANWNSRVESALKHWVSKGRLTQAHAARIRALPPSEQAREIFILEEQGIFFSTAFNKTILYSVAAPGASQHITMLALDIQEYDNPEVRKILYRHGWYQTIPTDLPHFTWLGLTANYFPALGLKQVVKDGRSYWVPDL